jgi:hypothetical protein
VETLKRTTEVRINVPALIAVLAVATPAFSQQQSNTVTAEIFARLPQSVGNVAFTPDNQVIFSHHPFYSPDVRAAKFISPTAFEPFPNPEWNTPHEGSDQYLDNVLGLRSDENGIVSAVDSLRARPLVTTESAEAERTSMPRSVYDDLAQRWSEVPVLARADLPYGRPVHGPVLIEDASSTLAVPNDDVVIRDAADNIIITMSANPATEDRAADFTTGE